MMEGFPRLKRVVVGALVGLAVTAALIAVYGFVRAIPYLWAADRDAGVANEDMRGRIILHCIVLYGLLVGPMGALVGAGSATVAVLPRRRRAG